MTVPRDGAEEALWSLGDHPDRIFAAAPEATPEGVGLALGHLRAQLSLGADAETAINETGRAIKDMPERHRTSAFLALLVACGELRSRSDLPFSARLLRHLPATQNSDDGAQRAEDAWMATPGPAQAPSSGS